MKNFTIVIFLLILSVSLINAKGDQNRGRKTLNKTNGLPEYTKFNINNISTFIKNDGEADLGIDLNSGFVYPKGTNKTVFFQSGFLYGGKINGEIRVGGSTYNQGQVQGRIISEGVAENPELSHVRIYRVRRDYKFAVLNDEIVSPAEARNLYEKDWNEWPAQYGAPFEDTNNNGIYEPSVDIPGEPGADQTIWFVANDLDSVKTKELYGSPPIGIEMQMSAWGYIGNEALENTVFKKYVLINKSSKPIDDMYVAMWSDPDVGDATDDYYGCDTTLNLAYSYNGDNYDATYGEQIPAAGFKLLKGPKVLNNNLGMTSFLGIIKSTPDYGDPWLDDYEKGTLPMYNFFQGKVAGGEHLFQSRLDNSYTKYMVSGDPVTGEGWVDGVFLPLGDRRMMMSSGPFEMAVGDTQVVIFAQIAAVGSDRFESIKLLKNYSSILDSPEVYNLILSRPVITETYNGINDNIFFEWDNSTENKNYENYQFQGYRIYQFESDGIFSKSNGKEIAVFNMKNGIEETQGAVVERSSGPSIYKSTDSGIKNKIEIEKDYINNSNFIIGREYYFGVAAYYFDTFNNKTVESSASVFSVIYKKNYSGPKMGDTIAVRKTKGIGNLSLNVEIVDPAKITGHDYRIWFTSVKDTAKWNLTDINTGDVLISDKVFGTYNYEDSNLFGYSDLSYISSEGLKLSIKLTPETITNIEVVANQSGKLVPSEGGAWPDVGFPSKLPTQGQQVGKGIWLFHTSDNVSYGTNDSYQAFQTYSLRNYKKIIPYDWEMRFTEQGSYAFRFQDDKITKVPFELWCIGENTPDDPGDDYKLIPWIFDRGDDSTFNLESWGSPSNHPGTYGIYDHSVSDGDDDPYTDLVYWIQPEDKTPGTAGYDSYVSSLDLINNTAGTYDLGGTEIFAKTVLVNLNGGSAPPFNQELPETGTVFRITSGKYVKAGIDEYEFSTTSIEKYLKEILLENKFTLSQNFPNPFNPTTKIKYKIPLENVLGVKNLSVKLIIYDILGREITKLVNTIQPPGDYEVTFDASNFASGVYIYLLTAGDFKDVKKMVLLK